MKTMKTKYAGCNQCTTRAGEVSLKIVNDVSVGGELVGQIITHKWAWYSYEKPLPINITVCYVDQKAPPSEWPEKKYQVLPPNCFCPLDPRKVFISPSLHGEVDEEAFFKEARRLKREAKKWIQQVHEAKLLGFNLSLVERTA